jgi:hypothetical protein
MNLWRRSARRSRLEKNKNTEVRRIMEVEQTITEVTGEKS